MGAILSNLTEGGGEWERETMTGLPLLFSHTLIHPVVKFWMQIIYTLIILALNTSTVNVFRVISLTSILHKKRIYLGTWMYQHMRCMWREMRIEVIFHTWTQTYFVELA
ncbi:hypothetical protein J1N35_019182 [Gossypium stocksii]|uniref:Uncharacterized protein n=1 Tax=Gossypium stocksii TaxID=47602 RepID=A0A9D3VSH4_9ROSI|nr:hypothetical protein J1N35_019182 [Gossypium stocksii]